MVILWGGGAMVPLATMAQAMDPYHYRPVKQMKAAHGVIATAHPLASLAGARILRQGGNAVDAALAAQLALAVVYPAAGNIGGGGFMVLHLHDGRNTTIDFRETAPAAAKRDMYLDADGNADPHLSREGALSVGVPGTIAGIFLAHEKYGSAPMRSIIQPAIDLAAGGYAISAAEAAGLNHAQEAFREYNTVMPVFVKPGGWHEGDTLRQPDLARTLIAIRDHGMAGFYGGETAEKIVAEMQRSHGIITREDLAHYRAVERQPVEFTYHGYRLICMPPPSSGGILLEQMLKMLSRYPVGDYGFESTRSVQLMVEIERRAYADRAQFLGDPDFVAMPLDSLVSDAYLRRRMADYDPSRATPSREVAAGQFAHESEETTHLSVADSQGNVVSVTYTLNSGYGSKVVVGGAGFILNDEMDDFSAKPGAPNMFGLVGAEANAISPGKRMLSSMTPTVVLKGNKPYLVLGTPGGATIITSVFQTLVDLLDFGMSVSDAVNQPKFHEQWRPDLVYVEAGFPDSVQRNMEKMGYRFTTRSPIGRTEVIRIENAVMEAVADKRGDDSVAGY
jgi:gamma-glutamyltranspeptidase/glutathione hydrolase